MQQGLTGSEYARGDPGVLVRKARKVRKATEVWGFAPNWAKSNGVRALFLGVFLLRAHIPEVTGPIPIPSGGMSSSRCSRPFVASMHLLSTIAWHIDTGNAAEGNTKISYYPASIIMKPLFVDGRQSCKPSYRRLISNLQYCSSLGR